MSPSLTRAIRSILVHLDGTPSSVARLVTARHLALRAEARHCAMFVASPPERPLQLALSEAPAALLQTVDWAAAGRARSSFDAAVDEDGPPMRWLDSTGVDPVEAFCRQALYADLLVLGQHDPSAVPGTAAPAGFVESALIDTGRPTLIVPHTGSFESIGHDVLIGWNATPQAAHAVGAALPWLRGARHVHVLESADPSSRRGDRDGRLIHCQTPAITATGTRQKKAPRQPMTEPR